MLLEGECWQARSDGSLSRAPDEELTPFFVVTHVHSDSQHRFTDVKGWSDLCNRLEHLRPSDNLFMAIRMHGHFDRLEVRSVSAVESGTTLETAAAAQTVFDLRRVSGTVVGFWSPLYATSLNIPGYHLHFLSDDRRCGGHVLENEALQADLSHDPGAVLPRAEGSAG